ncbi:N-methyl-L-tryptophan oxidase [Haloferax sp. AB510]|uniref:N-methyl-L-tryptophan oxidase n=1 Tax=Haloferax sp. AB510 TaxID=2934172 RepID=UPI00209C456A|nr:N-methyl-L-tryptophan oxidase [Haloferax sp. AB510]MCO8265416.1 N-methyl-L-tryptophan oxidase [Haloferax sp. AB510]
MLVDRDRHFDVIVIGVGGIGSATVYELARSGNDVLGIERHGIPHTKGSSHGHTRMIRRAYHENPEYMAMIDQAYTRWEQLEDEWGEQLLYKTGSIAAGRPSCDLVSGALETCHEHSVPFEKIDGESASERFPGFQFPSEYEVVVQSDGGFVRPEAATIAHVELARQLGATIQSETKVTSWESTIDGVKVKTEDGQYKADRLVIAAGAWIGKMVESLEGIVSPERQVLSWLQPNNETHFTPENCPVFLISDDDNIHYGFPTFGKPGVKFGRHYHLNERVDPDEMDHSVNEHDMEVLTQSGEKYLNVSGEDPFGFETCIYTNTPDRDFIIDTLPNHPEVTVLGGFSGHGYKFAGVIGKIAADLANGKDPEIDISLFEIDR